MQAEPEVRSCGPGQEPAARQIGFAEQRKTLPCSTPGSFCKVYNPQGLAAGKRKGGFFFSPLFGTKHQAPWRILQTSGFGQNAKLAWRRSDEPVARTSSVPVWYVDANDIFSDTFSKTENNIVDSLKIT